jgi:hypothetical protein
MLLLSCFYDTDHGLDEGGCMSGFQEILLVAVILMGILFLPRIMPGRIEQRPKPSAAVLSRNMRLAIAASIIYPAIAALFLQPWRRDVVMYMYAGLGPVVLGWLGYWAFTGRKR